MEENDQNTDKSSTESEKMPTKEQVDNSEPLTLSDEQERLFQESTVDMTFTGYEIADLLLILKDTGDRLSTIPPAILSDEDYNEAIGVITNLFEQFDDAASEIGSRLGFL